MTARRVTVLVRYREQPAAPAPAVSPARDAAFGELLAVLDDLLSADERRRRTTRRAA